MFFHKTELAMQKMRPIHHFVFKMWPTYERLNPNGRKHLATPNSDQA